MTDSSRPSGTRPGTRKPNITYDLTPETEQLFPRVYGRLLNHLLDALKATHSRADLEQVLRGVGHRWPTSAAPPWRSTVSASARELAVTVLGTLGGLAELEERRREIRHPTRSAVRWPMAVADHPEVCTLVETLLAEVTGTAVRQRCQQEPALQCYFEIRATET